MPPLPALAPPIPAARPWLVLQRVQLEQRWPEEKQAARQGVLLVLKPLVLLFLLMALPEFVGV